MKCQVKNSQHIEVLPQARSRPIRDPARTPGEYRGFNPKRGGAAKEAAQFAKVFLYTCRKYSQTL
jgi:hypothetical protein